MTATPASLYVEAHLPLLTAYSRSTRFRPAWIEPDDFQSDLVAQVLTAHHTFRDANSGSACRYCGGTGCSTWLGWRARKAASEILRKQRREREVLGTPEPEGTAEAMPAHHDTPGAVHARAVVQQMLDRATPEQRDALISKLEEWTGDEVWLRLGIGIGGRNYRLRRLIAALNDGGRHG